MTAVHGLQQTELSLTPVHMREINFLIHRYLLQKQQKVSKKTWKHTFKYFFFNWHLRYWSFWLSHSM